MIQKWNLVYGLSLALIIVGLVSCEPSIEKEISAFDNAVTMLEENQNLSSFDEVEEFKSICEDNMTTLNDRLSDFTPEQIKRVSEIKRRYHRSCSVIMCNAQMATLEKSMSFLESNYKNLSSEVLKDSISMFKNNIESFKNSDRELSQEQKERLSNIEKRYNQFCIDSKFDLQVGALEKTIEELNGYENLKPNQLEDLLNLGYEQLNVLKNEKQEITPNQEDIVNDLEKKLAMVVTKIKADRKTKGLRNLSPLYELILKKLK